MTENACLQALAETIREIHPAARGFSDTEAAVWFCDNAPSRENVAETLEMAADRVCGKRTGQMEAAASGTAG